MSTLAFPRAITPGKPVRINPLQQWSLFSQPRAMHDWIRDHYGDLATLHFQGRDHTVVLTPESAREVFSRDPDGYDAFWKESFAGLTGGFDSVWVLIRDEHRRERQLFAPAVHAGHFRRHAEVIHDAVRLHIEQWRSGQEIRAVDTTRAIALDIIMRLVFGVEDEDLLDDGRQILEKLRSTVHPLIVFYPKLQRNWFPPWRRFVGARARMYDWVNQVLAVRRAARTSEQPGDVLAMLMQARDADGRPVSDEHIRVELNSVLGAGHETTGVALAWALYELGRHPAVMQKLRAELEEASELPVAAAVQSLPYLDAVVRETIRLHPILSECARVPIQPLQIRGHTIPAGQALVISIVSIHHHPEVYPDPDKFSPERFLERNYSNYEFLPFGGGHRRCLGAALAEFTLKIALAYAAAHWDLETTAVDYDIRNDIAMGPRYGVRMRVHRRERFAHADHSIRGQLT